MLSIHAASAAEEFVLAHEYAHIIRGDVGHLLDQSAVPQPRVGEESDDETAADLWAADAVMRVAESEEEQIVRCTGPLVFLSTLKLIEAYFEQRKQMPRSDTHPPAGNRIVQLRYSLAKAGFNRAAQLGATFYKFSLLIAEELGLEVKSHEAQLLIADHVGGLVDDELQEPEPLVKQTFRIFQQRLPMSAKKPWWKLR